MKVFISWSGEQSRAMAEALRWWLPKVIQGVVPFVSGKDIDKGANWTSVLHTELQATNFGIVCLAADNLRSPWLHYEVGALGKSVDARVCPLLWGITKGEVAAPMNQLQLTDFELEDVRLMMRSLNRTMEQPLADDHLDDAVEMWWPTLAKRFEQLPDAAAEIVENASEPTRPSVTQSDMFLEILAEIRTLRDQVPDARRRKQLVAESDDDVPRIFSTVTDHGLIVHRGSSGKTHTTVNVAEVPYPLPGRLHARLSDYAAEMKRGITLIGDDGSMIEFDQTGHSSTPPF